MIFVNTLDKEKEVSRKDYETLLLLLSPFAPHISEELWHLIGHTTSIHLEKWPIYDPFKINMGNIVMAIQINGKVRASIEVDSEAGEEEVKAKALSLPEVQKWLENKEPKKVILVPKKIISIVT